MVHYCNNTLMQFFRKVFFGFLFGIVILPKETQANQQCNNSIVAKQFGSIEYFASPVQRRQIKECKWKFTLPESKQFILVLEFDFLKNYGEDDHLILPDGTTLPRQTILPEDRDPLCISYTLPETAYSNCVRELREKHCPKSEPKVAKQPFQMSVRSLSGRSDDRGFFHHTNFRAAFKFYSCVEEHSAEKKFRNSIADLPTIVVDSRTSESWPVSTIVIGLVLTLCVVSIGILLFVLCREKRLEHKTESSDQSSFGATNTVGTANNQAVPHTDKLSSIPLVYPQCPQPQNYHQIYRAQFAGPRSAEGPSNSEFYSRSNYDSAPPKYVSDCFLPMESDLNSRHQFDDVSGDSELSTSSYCSGRMRNRESGQICSSMDEDESDTSRTPRSISIVVSENEETVVEIGSDSNTLQNDFAQNEKQPGRSPIGDYNRRRETRVDVDGVSPLPSHTSSCLTTLSGYSDVLYLAQKCGVRENSQSPGQTFNYRGEMIPLITPVPSPTPPFDPFACDLFEATQPVFQSGPSQSIEPLLVSRYSEFDQEIDASLTNVEPTTPGQTSVAHPASVLLQTSGGSRFSPQNVSASPFSFKAVQGGPAPQEDPLLVSPRSDQMWSSTTATYGSVTDRSILNDDGRTTADHEQAPNANGNYDVTQHQVIAGLVKILITTALHLLNPQTSSVDSFHSRSVFRGSKRLLTSAAGRKHRSAIGSILAMRSINNAGKKSSPSRVRFSTMLPGSTASSETVATDVASPASLSTRTSASASTAESDEVTMSSVASVNGSDTHTASTSSSADGLSRNQSEPSLPSKSKSMHERRSLHGIASGSEMRGYAEDLILEALDELTAALKKRMQSLEDDSDASSKSSDAENVADSKFPSSTQQPFKKIDARKVGVSNSSSSPQLYAAKLIMEALTGLAASMQQEENAKELAQTSPVISVNGGDASDYESSTSPKTVQQEIEAASSMDVHYEDAVSTINVQPTEDSNSVSEPSRAIARWRELIATALARPQEESRFIKITKQVQNTFQSESEAKIAATEQMESLTLYESAMSQPPTTLSTDARKQSSLENARKSKLKTQNRSSKLGVIAEEKDAILLPAGLNKTSLSVLPVSRMEDSGTIPIGGSPAQLVTSSTTAIQHDQSPSELKNLQNVERVTDEEQ